MRQGKIWESEENEKKCLCQGNSFSVNLRCLKFEIF